MTKHVRLCLVESEDEKELVATVGFREADCLSTHHYALRGRPKPSRRIGGGSPRTGPARAGSRRPRYA